MADIVLSDIFIYPVKSLSGIKLTSWPVVETGFKFDRQWMLIDKERQFLSQRRLPKMALMKTAIAGNQIIVSAPGVDNLVLELEPIPGETINSTIWHDHVDTLAVSAEADEWFSRFLETDCRLVYQPEKVTRHVNPDYAKPADRTALSDGFPFLLVSENSLQSLNQSMDTEIPMTRFRPNLVVSGSGSYAEDTWREITIGAIDFRLPKPCSRCSVPTIDPDTAETGKEPLATLNRLRKWENKVYFGQNALHDSLGQLSVGDKVTVNMTGSPQPPL